MTQNWFAEISASVVIIFIAGLNGKDDWEAAKIQMLHGGVEDLMTHFIPWFREQDADKKVCHMKHFR